MADKISRALAITICENHLLMKQADYMPDASPLLEAYKTGFRDAIKDLILDLEAINAKQEWIPAEEGLPRREGTYLITDRFGEVWLSEFFNGKWYTDGGDVAFEVDAVAWQNMPKAYRKKEEKKKYDRFSSER